MTTAERIAELAAAMSAVTAEQAEAAACVLAASVERVAA